ncbi:hypothetical protein PTKIN_Ptkin04bG0057900 [Pterospermum kingtungense]
MESRPVSAATPSEEIPISSMPKDGSATPITLTQAMEPPGGGSSPSSTASYRIPSHVFARTSPASPMEWSAASNESLFSIQMGNASFSREQLSWMSKSGELGYISDSPYSGPLAHVPSDKQQTPTKKCSAGGELNDQGQLYGVAQAAAAAAETMREVLSQKESTQQHKDNVVAKEPLHLRSMSQHSDASVKSFAFPILTGDTDKSSSLRKSAKNKNPVLPQPSSTPKTTSEARPKAETSPETTKPETPPEAPKPETPKSQTPKATRNAGPRKLFSCFSCCPSCS